MADSQIRVLSLNCWGLKYVAKNRNERIEAIAQALSQFDHDIIALQEIWVYADYQKVKDRISRRLPNSKFFYSGALGSGLAIFTRFPIIEASVHPYALNGSPIDVGAGDWFVGKAAASIVILHPVLGPVQVFNTHLFAKGGEDGPEYNRAHRLVNAYEFAKLARQAAELGRYVIALGDFNSIPPTLPMRVILDHAGLIDAWVVTHPNADASSATTALEAITKLGMTADSPLNSWSAGKGYAFGTWGKRLDYVLYRQPKRQYTAPGEKLPVLKARDCRVALTEKVPGHQFSYSDHFALEATLEIQSSSPTSVIDDIPTELTDASVSTFIQALTACYRFSRQRARKELTVFTLCILLLVGLAVGSGWLPHSWINPIFIVFTVFVSWAGTTMLYQGFLYGNWECNALMNVIEELEIYRKGLDIQARTSGDY
ncbi:inositol phosphophingolipids phospholipase C [Crucibulum laeve]|uniref:Inositol phosphophingolipids phospholipase C n=1 Tax=Crucibulum laeve TaxID=68775 RepID=A0A5C3MAT6_9AGAR|nr:inositol phosphophingolipids phospholipase C [Crucibulum laeve]